MGLSFAKYEGLGNDFIVVERGFPPHFAPADVRALCDRHRGIGADGVLLTGLTDGRPFMQVFNADGSAPEMCGNGLRCVALYLRHRRLVAATSFEIDTGAGPHAVRVASTGETGEVWVAMRAASLEAGLVLTQEAAAGMASHLDRPFEVDGRPVNLTTVSMGNPHVVTFDDLADRIDSLGPRIERDSRFRAGANVGFAVMRGRSAMDLRVWERGCGFTLACGTGACAAAVAAVETGRAPRHEALLVHLPGGVVSVRVGAAGAPVEMTGPARRVFQGHAFHPPPGAQP